jgi:CO/xanthine dehydrogenase Mo-binding subunit
MSLWSLYTDSASSSYGGQKEHVGTGRGDMMIDSSQGDITLRVIGPSIAEPDTPVSSELEDTLLIITKEGKVIVFSGKVEYGQGIRSGFQLAVADELDIPVSTVQVVLGDTRAVPYDRGTTGSASTRTVWVYSYAVRQQQPELRC